MNKAPGGWNRQMGMIRPDRPFTRAPGTRRYKWMAPGTMRPPMGGGGVPPLKSPPIFQGGGYDGSGINPGGTMYPGGGWGGRPMPPQYPGPSGPIIDPTQLPGRGFPPYQGGPGQSPPIYNPYPGGIPYPGGTNNLPGKYLPPVHSSNQLPNGYGKYVPQKLYPGGYMHTMQGG